MSVRRLSRRALACTQRAVHPCATLALCHARQQALVVRPRLRGRARARITPPPPPRCAAPLHARIVAGFRTHTARRLRHLPILSASAPLRHPGAATSIAPGRWRRPLCMRAPRFLCARNGPTNLEVRAAPGSAAADGSRGRRQTHTRQVGTPSSALRRGSGKGAERECDISLNRTEKVESNSANRCELIVGDL